MFLTRKKRFDNAAVGYDPLPSEIGAWASQFAGSVSLGGDSLDFLSDSANYAISLLVARMALRRLAKAASGKGATMGLFAIWVLGSAAWKRVQGTPPES